MSEAHTRSSRSGPVVVLLVEDDREMRELLVDTLQRDGHFVLAASSASDAVELLAAAFDQRKRDVDLVLTDVQMAGATGIDLGQELRKNDKTMPLILMTAFPGPNVRQAAGQLGATILEKPFRLEVLRRVVLTTIAAGRDVPPRA